MEVTAITLFGRYLHARGEREEKVDEKEKEKGGKKDCSRRERIILGTLGEPHRCLRKRGGRSKRKGGRERGEKDADCIHPLRSP